MLLNEHEVQADTRLTAAQQEARHLSAKMWAHRILALQFLTGCDIRLALRAVEQADADTPRERERGA